MHPQSLGLVALVPVVYQPAWLNTQHLNKEAANMYMLRAGIAGG